jgi:potassium efflux system protein
MGGRRAARGKGLKAIGLVLRLFALLLILGGSVHAAEDGARDALEQVKATLSEIDDELKLDTLSDSELAQLRTRVDPLGGQLQTVISELQPRLDASRKRLDELKPKDKDAPAATDPAADELKAEQARFDKLDADLRSARAALLQVDDYATRISSMRRDIFTKQTFARSSSVLSPVLWLAVAREAPSDVMSFQNIVAGAGRRLAARATYSEVGGFLGVLAALLAVAAPLRWVARRVIEPHSGLGAPGRLRKALVALWTLAVLAALPLFGLWVVAYALDVFDISDPQMQGVVEATLDGLRLLAVTYAVARALCSPKRPDWRLLNVGDEVARRLTRLAISIAVVWGAAKIVEAMAETVLSYNLLVTTRGVAALIVVALAADAFRRIARSPDLPVAKDVGRPARTFAWIYLAAILVCALSGYIALATYLIEHAVQFVGAVCILYLLDALLQEACERLLRPDSSFAPGVMTLLGLRRGGLEQIVVLAQGAARLAVIAGAIAVAVGPFGLPSQDLVATLRTAYFGFSVGGVTLSLSSLVAALVVFLLLIAATRAAQGWLGDRYLPRTRLDSGVQNSIVTIFGYVGVVIAVLASGSRLGVDAERLTWVAGGLSVGIGFGLQGIANNFIAGLILLWERGIRVGDWVVVGTDQGFVRRINARATEIETFDRATMIVPNNTLVTGSVKNWMHTDRVARITVTIFAAYESDPETVRRILIDAAKSQEAVLSIPAPLALFAECAEWAMRFHLYAYVEDALMAERVKSEINFEVMQRMRQANMRIPYPFPVSNVEAERGPNVSGLPTG